MATIKQFFDAFNLVLPSTGFAQMDTVQGTNFPIPVLAFDQTADEAAFAIFSPVGYGSGNLDVDIDWYADTASSGVVRWGVSLAAITPDADTQDIETKAFATEQTVDDTHLGTTNQRLHRATVSLSNLDSIAEGDWCVLRIRRIGSDAADTMTGDALLAGVKIAYAD